MKSSSNKKTKIIATYGPACEQKGLLTELFKTGVDLIRLNASHNAEKSLLKKVITKVRKQSEKSNKRVGVFLDLQGPKIRVGKFKKDKTNCYNRKRHKIIRVHP